MRLARKARHSESGLASRACRARRARRALERPADFFGILLAADNKKVAWSNGRAGEAILCLERLERDAKPFRHFS